MKIIVIIFVSITFLIFGFSSLISNTTLFDTSLYILLVKFDIEKYLNSIYVYSSLLLVFFIIYHANYMIKVYGKTKKRTTQKVVGLIFGLFVVVTALVHYYATVSIFKNVQEMHKIMPMRTAEKTIADAHSEYHLNGVIIEYFDTNKTIVKFAPTEEDTYIRDSISLQIDELHRQPTYITVAFLLIMMSFYLSGVFAEQTVKKHNKNEERNL